MISSRIPECLFFPAEGIFGRKGFPKGCRGFGYGGGRRERPPASVWMCAGRPGPGYSGPGRCTNSARPSAPREPRRSTRSRQSCRGHPDRGAGASAPEIPPPARPAQWSAPTGSRPQVRIDFHAGHESPSGFQSPAFSAILMDSGRWLNQIFALGK